MALWVRKRVPRDKRHVLGHLLALGGAVVLATPRPLTCPKNDRPWLWASSSPVSTSQLSALGEQRTGAQGAEWLCWPAHVQGFGEERKVPELGTLAWSPSCDPPTYQGVLQLWVRVRYRMPRW